MEAGEYLNEHGKRVRGRPDPPSKRRHMPVSDRMDDSEEWGYLAVQLLRKPQIEALARRQLAAYQQQLREMSGCYACSPSDRR